MSCRDTLSPIIINHIIISYRLLGFINVFGGAEQGCSVGVEGMHEGFSIHACSLAAQLILDLGSETKQDAIVGVVGGCALFCCLVVMSVVCLSVRLSVMPAMIWLENLLRFFLSNFFELSLQLLLSSLLFSALSTDGNATHGKGYVYLNHPKGTDGCLFFSSFRACSSLVHRSSRLTLRTDLTALLPAVLQFRSRHVIARL